MFRPSDVRRVQAAFDNALPAPYEAEIELADQRTTLMVRIADPDNNALTVGSVTWTFDAVRPKERQPSASELAQIVAAQVTVCNEHAEAEPEP